MAIAAGTKVGRYEIRAKIGEGGMGEVYRARDEKLSRDVAIKVLPATLSQNADRLRRFEQEAQAAGALNHPNILAVYDVDTHDGSPYVVSELLEGKTLRDQLGDGAVPQHKAITDWPPHTREESSTATSSQRISSSPKMDESRFSTLAWRSCSNPFAM